MIRRPPRSTRTDTLFPYTTLFRSLLLMEGIMALERPHYVLEQQYPHLELRCTDWSPYGIYRSFDREMEKAALLNRPCRITQYLVVWRSIRSEARRVGQECVRTG